MKPTKKSSKTKVAKSPPKPSTEGVEDDLTPLLNEEDMGEIEEIAEADESAFLSLEESEAELAKAQLEDTQPARSWPVRKEAERITVWYSTIQRSTQRVVKTDHFAEFIDKPEQPIGQSTQKFSDGSSLELFTARSTRSAEHAAQEAIRLSAELKSAP